MGYFTRPQLLWFIVFFAVPSAFGQYATKRLAIDRYNPNGMSVMVGDELAFKVKGDKTLYRSMIVALKDSSFIIKDGRQEIFLSSLSEVREQRKALDAISVGTAGMAGGFLFAWVAHPYVNENATTGNETYNRTDAAYIGAGFAAISIGLRLGRTKKYKIGKSARARIIETDFRKEFP